MTPQQLLSRLRALGADALVDSAGLLITGANKLPPDVREAVVQLKPQLSALLTTRRPHFTCAEDGCSEPSPSPTGRCVLHATLRVPLPTGWARCPACARLTWHAVRPCLHCQATQLVAEVLQGGAQ